MKTILSILITLLVSVGYTQTSGPIWVKKELVQSGVFNSPSFQFTNQYDNYKTSENISGLFIDGLDYKGNPSRFFAWYGVPESLPAGKKVPAVICVHGGGGTAFEAWVKKWTDRGYIAISMSLEGNVPGERDDNKQWPTFAYSGPSRNGFFKDVDKSLQDQWFYHAVADVILSNSLLRDPNFSNQIDTNQIGITGISWGGILTNVITGIDQRFDFSIPVYGCGYLPEAPLYAKQLSANTPEQQDFYKKNWEPSLYIPYQSAPTLHVNGTNDKHFSMNAFTKTHQAAPNEKYLRVELNMRHGHGAGWAPEDIYQFADYKTKSSQKRLKFISEKRTNDHQILYKYDYEGSLDKAYLYYTIDTADWSQTGYEWIEKEAIIKHEEQTISTLLSKDAVAYFVNAVSSDGLIFSSPMISRNLKTNTSLNIKLGNNIQGVSSNAYLDSGRTAVQFSSQKKFNIKDFGATGDSITLDTRAIQTAIDACTQSGGGLVRVPAGNYHIGTIHLKSNVTLSLDYGAVLLGSQNIRDYDDQLPKPREGGLHCLIFAQNATNVAIEGLGVIDGRGTPQAFPRDNKKGLPRPRLIRMENCNQLRFSGITYKRPAFWGIHLVDCTNVHFDGIKIRFRNNGYNNDGLDLDGCQNVLIENCDIDSGDDAICLKSTLHPCRNIVVRNCKVSSNTAAFKLGTSSRGGFIDIKVYNCFFYDCPMGAIKLQSVDGGQLENIDISRITMKDVGSPIFIRLGNRGREYKNFMGQIQSAEVEPEGAPVGTIKNIRISDVVAEVTIESPEKAAQASYKGLKKSDSDQVTDKQKAKAGPIMIAGIPGHYVEQVLLENIEISFPGQGSAEDGKRTVPEDIARYPEQFFFGVLPAWGAYIRHARNIEFRNVKLTTRNQDERKAIVSEDVEGFVNDTNN